MKNKDIRPPRKKRITVPKKFNFFIWKEEWWIYPIIIFVSYLALIISYRYYNNTEIYKHHQIVKVVPYSSQKYRSRSNTPYGISFVYENKDFHLGIYTDPFKLMAQNGEIELMYNKKLDKFLDPNINPRNFDIDLFFIGCCLAGDIYLLYKFFSGEYKNWD